MADHDEEEEEVRDVSRSVALEELGTRRAIAGVLRWLLEVAMAQRALARRVTALENPRQ